MRATNPANVFGRRAVLASMTVALLANSCGSKKGVPTSSQALRPEDPVDESFRGCQLSTSCRGRAAPDGVTLVLQPAPSPVTTRDVQ
jgi:hypothetical protein